MAKVYTLKRATPRMKLVHMNHVMQWKDQLKAQQAEEAARKYRAEGLEVCQQLRDLLTQDQYNAWWETAPEDGFFDAARAKLKELRAARSYKNHHVPDRPCPKCGGLLIVRARHLKQRGKDDYVTEFISCSRFETNGCKYTSPLTDDIRAAIDAQIAITANTAPEF